MAIETTRTIRLDQLVGELNDGGVSVPNGLGSHTVGDTTTIHTYDGDGHIVALTDAAQAIVDQHTARVNAKGLAGRAFGGAHLEAEEAPGSQQIQ